MTVSLGLIGAGAMGGALAAGLVSAGWEPSRITTVDASPDRLAELADLGYRTSDDVSVLVGHDVIVVAVKPHHVASALGPLAGRLGNQQLVISIAAGVGIAAIESVIGLVPVVRCMPNTPALVGEGMSAIASGSAASERHLEVAAEILSAVGKVVVVDESALDAVTAVSGSGPAYVFLLAEAMMAAALEQGLEADVADTLVRQTIAGAGKLLAASPDGPGELREKVTSPGGTTEAALGVMAEAGFADLVARAIESAAARSRQLGREEGTS